MKFCSIPKATSGSSSGNDTNTNASVAPDTEVKSNGHMKPDEMTSKDYYFDSYAHFGIHEVRLLTALCIRWFKIIADLPTCTDFRGTHRFWSSITISRFHAVVYRFWKMREFLGLADFILFCFRRYSVILSAPWTYRQSRRCVAAINSPPGAMSQC